jgi:hypothetical protein
MANGLENQGAQSEQMSLIMDKSFFGSDSSLAEEYLKDDPEYSSASTQSNDDSENSNDENEGVDNPEKDTLENSDKEESDAEIDDIESEYEDDIIPGLKGSQFSELPEDIQTIVATTRNKIDEMSNELKTVKEEYEALLKDPVVQHRKDLIQQGISENAYEIPEVSAQLLNKIKQAFDSDNLEKAAELINEYGKNTADAGASKANMMMSERQKREATLSKAAENLFKLSKLNPALNIDIDDVSKIINTPFEKLGVIGEILTDLQQKKADGIIGNVARYIAETDPEVLYAQIAIKKNLPIVKNADKQINDKIKKSNNELLDRFKKSKDKSSGQMPTDTSVDNKSVHKSSHIRDGIDIIKLAKDDDYHEQILNQRQDIKWLEKISQLRADGEKLLEKSPRLSSRK